jgi:RNA polymerase sigma factor (sigma-70 family)
MTARLTAAFDPLAPDAALLDRFRRERDGAAFALLVRRHGPLVLGVCRRVTGDVHLADDAFQAAWLVLARKPEAVAPAGAVRGFLYGVAVNVSRRARTARGRRLRRERPTGQVPDVAAGPPTADPEAVRIVGEEVGRLPEHLRAAVVLCELDGLSRADAAGRLGIPEGTLSSRLAKARTLLARSLARRGVTGLGVLGAAGGGAAVSPALAAAAVALGTGGPAAAGVTALAGSMMRAVFLGRLAVAAAVLTAGVAGGVAVLATPGPADDPPKPAPAAQPKPKPADPGKLLVFHTDKHVLLDPAGKLLAERTFKHPEGRVMIDGRLSPDGGWVALLAEGTPETVGDQTYRRRHVMVYPADGGDGRKLVANPATLFWLPGGDLLVSELIEAAELKDRGFATVRLNPVTGARTPLDLPRLFMPEAVGPDGQTFVGVRIDLEKQKAFFCRMTPGGKPDDLSELRTEGTDARLSPDGKRVLFRDFDPADAPAEGMPRMRRLFVYDLPARKRTRLAGVPDDALVNGFCWSPDGKRLAYSWKKALPGVPLAYNTETQKDPKLNTPTESFLTVADADGGNAKNVRSGKSDSGPGISLGEVDWR